MKGKLHTPALWLDASTRYSSWKFLNHIAHSLALIGLIWAALAQTAWSNGAPHISLTAPPDLTLETSGPANATCGDLVDVTIAVVGGFTDIGALQYSVNWNETQLKYISHSALEIGGVGGDPIVGGDTDNGELVYVWLDPDGATGEDLADGTVLLTITFQVVGGGAAAVEITDTPLLMEVSNSLFETNTITTQNNASITLDAPVVTLTLGTNFACPNDTMVELTGGLPPGGTYLGLGVTGTNFDATVAGVGIHTITYLYDFGGCSGSATDDMTVDDIAVPMIACPVLLVTENADANCEYTVSGTGLDATATDNCIVASIVNDYNGTATLDGAAFTAGTTVVLWTATDGVGLTATCAVEITVNDVTPPTAECQDITVNLDAEGKALVMGMDLDNGSSDNCDNPVGLFVTGFAYYYAFNHWTFSSTGDGSADDSGLPTSVALTSNDDGNDGDTKICIDIPQTTTVAFTWDYFTPDEPQFDPFGFEVNGAFTQLSDNAGGFFQSGTAVVALNEGDNFCLVANSFDGLFGAATTTISPFHVSKTQFSCDDIGDNGVTLTALDSAGNTSTCSATVTVVDVTPPVLSYTFPDTYNVNVTSGDCSTVVTIERPSVTDCVVPIFDNFELSVCGAIMLQPTEGPAIINGVPDPDFLNVIPALDVCDPSTKFVAIQFPVGITEIPYIWCDGFGNCDTVTITITVIETGVPVANCIGTVIPLSLNANGFVVVNPDLVNATSGDNCGLDSIWVTPDTLTCANLGDNIVTLTVSDGDGNTSTCTATVNVVDELAPIVNCPTDFVASTDTFTCDAMAENIPGLLLTELPADGIINAPGQYKDNCGVVSIGYTLTGATSGSGTYPIPDGTVFNIGATAVTYIFEDADGNTTSCSFNVTVEDLVPPQTLDCPTPAPVTANLAGCIAVVTWTPPTFTDNCPGALLLTNSHNPGQFFNLGATLITYTATDVAGNIGICTFEVVVLDDQPPVAICKDIEVFLDANGTVTVEPSQLNNNSTDNCFLALVSDTVTYNCLNVGPNDYLFIVEDFSNARDSSVCVVTVSDTLAPVITDCDLFVAPDIDLDADCQFVLNAADYALNFNIEDNTLNDAPPCPLTFEVDVDGSGFAAEYQFTCQDKGANIVTFRATDVFGNTAVCTKTVTANDVTPPVIIDADVVAPPDVTVECSDYDANDFATLGQITLADVTDACDDACGATLDIAFSDSEAPGSCANSFFVFRTWTVSDQSGNFTTHFQTITVLDTQAPLISDVDTLISLEANNYDDVPQCVATHTVEILDANVTDNCTTDFADYTITYVIDLAPLGVGPNLNGTGAAATADFPIGISEVTFTVTDPCGNSSEVTVTVEVADVNGPVINEPFGAYLGNTNLVCDSTFVILNATGNCGNIFSWYRPFANANEESFFDCSNYTVTETISDASVQSAINASSPFTYVNPPMFGIFPTTFFPVGNTVITYTATDEVGNTTVCAFTVRVIDNEAPTILCPSDQNLSITAGCTDETLVPSYINGLQVTDNCPSNVFITQTPAAGTTLSDVVANVQAGETFIVTMMAQDGQADSLSAVPCTFTVTLFDGTSPVPVLPFLPDILTSCGLDTVEAPMALDCNGIDFDTIYGTPSAPVVEILPPLVPGGPPRYVLNAGNYAITWSYTDPQNNTTTQLQSVQIQPDNNPPLAFCQQPFTVELTPAGDYALSVAEIDDGSTDPDDCGPVDLDISPAVLTCADLNDPVTVVLTVTDVSGNTAQCSTSVLALDVTAPELSPIPADLALEACDPIPNPASVTAADACDNNVEIAFQQDTVLFLNDYSYVLQRLWTATDDAGNVSTGTQLIVILDTQAPQIIGAPDTLVVFTDLNNLDCKDTVSFDIFPFINDCDTTSLTITNNLSDQGTEFFDVLAVGTYTLIYTVRDGNDNETTHEIFIEVKDGTDPIAACINGVSVSLQASGTVTVTAANINASSSDNCTAQNDLALSIQRLNPLGPITSAIVFTCPDADGVTQHPVRLYVEDEAGNQAICETFIVVQDNVVPTIAACPPDRTVICNADLSPDTQGFALANDNCPTTTVSFTDAIVAGTGNACYDIQRTWTAIDQANNSATCVQILSVLDTIKPTLSLLPADITIGCTDTLTVPPVVTAFDNCTNNVSVVLELDTINVGQGSCGQFSYTVQRTWIATDDCGNSAVHTQNVVVTDDEAPVFTGMPDTVTLFTASFPINLTCSVNWSFDVAQFVSDCQPDSLLTITNNGPQGDGNSDLSGEYVVGLYSIQITAKDACDNTAVDSIILVVIDNSIPTLICNNDIVIALGTNGQALLSPNDVDLGSTDNCGIDTMFLSKNLFDCSDLGFNPVTLTAVDEAGNLNACTVNVNVTPGLNQVFTLVTTSTPESVSGANDGTATATPSGGSGQYTYEWSTTATTPTITGLAAGTYTVTVIDQSNGCRQVDTIVVDEGLRITLSVGNAEGCIGQTLSVPVTVENFSDVIGFNFELSVTDNNVGTLLGITANSVHPSLAAAFTPTLNAGLLEVEWADTALTLPSGTVLFSVDIQLGAAAIGSASPVVVTNEIFEILVNGDTATANVTVVNGSVEITCDEPELEIGGDIQTWNNPQPVPGVLVSLTGDVVADQTTGPDGTYLFPVPNNTNTTVKCFKSTPGNDAITGADILLIKRHVLGVQLLTSPYQFVAADVSSDGNLSILDYARIQQVALGLQDHITGSLDWKFIPKSYVFPSPNPISVEPDSTISHLPATMSFLDDDFVAVRMGDVNGNIVPSFTDDDADDRSGGTFLFRLDERSFQQGETFEVAFKANDFNERSGWQMTLQFDPKVLELVDIVPGALPDMNDANFGAMRAKEGLLTSLWVNAVPMTLPDGTVLFTLRFKALRNGASLEEMLHPSSQITRAEGYDRDGQPLYLDFAFTQRENGADAATFALYQNQPNPFNSLTTIAFRLPESGPATLRVFNTAGQLLKQISADFDKGYHELRFRRDELGAPGVYYYELEAAQHSARKKMVLLD